MNTKQQTLHRISLDSDHNFIIIQRLLLLYAQTPKNTMLNCWKPSRKRHFQVSVCLSERWQNA